MAVLILCSCDRKNSAINSRGSEERFLGAIEITDGETIHWGEQTFALQKLKMARVSYSLGEITLGMADLWCSSADYDKAHALIETLGESSSSGFRSVGEFAGLTKKELHHLTNESAPPQNQNGEGQAMPGQ